MFEAEYAGDRRVARVLLDSQLPQLDHLFDYVVPESLADELRVGQRVRVPFRSQRRQSHGYVIEFTEASDFAGELQEITETVGPVPLLAHDMWVLARALADRAGGSAGDIIRLAIPKRLVRAEKAFLGEQSSNPVAERSDDLSEERIADDGERDETVEHAEQAEHDATHELGELLLAGGRASVLVSHGPVRLSTGEWVGGHSVRLAEIAMRVFSQGRSVIIVAPDYRDLDQLRDVFAAFGHERLVRVDAKQPDADRYTAFLRARSTEPQIVIGNRSAVYAPASRLGAILVWDDGDPLLSEPLAPYVHARDAALVRAEQQQAGLAFLAYSRSADVQRLIDIGYVQTERFPPRRTHVVHADSAVAPESFAGRVPEFAARTIREAVRVGPVLVQVATPGYAPVAVCADCGERARCLSCAGPIGFRRAGVPSCRWCGESAGPHAWACAECEGRSLEQRGMGSQRTAEQFEQQFRGVRVVLSDGEHPIERIDSRPCLVVATRGAEPIAATGYRAVVLLDAERLLGIESLRAGEDCLRWWQNAAALAAPDGRVVVASGAGPVVNAMVTGRIEEWLHRELRDRQALRYPPMVRVASVTGGPQQVERALRALAPEEFPGVDVLGPAPGAEPQTVRALVRFDYASGAEIAKRLRGALVADAAGSRAQVGGRRRSGTGPQALRLRFDDRSVFDG